MSAVTTPKLDKPASGNRNFVRIIGGGWRGRRVSFPDVPGLRPTPDRVRETLFNWLQHDIAGTRCLDLFAGSGALGLEALSRGARKWSSSSRRRPRRAPSRRNSSVLAAARGHE